MGDTGNTAVAPNEKVEGSKSKKAVASGVKKAKSKPNHPPTAQMVNNAIKSLKERGGSSLPAIKKYLSANYKVDAEKLAPFIKKYLKNAVISGKLIQTKGKGASGSFKLSNTAKTQDEGKSVKKKKSVVEKPKVKTVKSEKKKSEGKKVEKKKISASAAVKANKKVPSSKLKQEKLKKEKTTKVASKAPKTPKPKKLAPVKKGTGKKVATK